jgi:hypothetical protein
MKRWICFTAAASSALTLAAMWGLGFATVPSTVKLENARVRISEVLYAPGVPREPLRAAN